MMFLFFKQKTAYEMRIRDWSSDVCSSDLFAARRSAGDADPALRRVAAFDQPLGHVHEVGEGVGALVQLPVQIPLLAEVVAAPDMRQREGEAAVQQRQAAGGEARRHRAAIGSIALAVQRRAAVGGPVIGLDDGPREWGGL